LYTTFSHDIVLNHQLDYVATMMNIGFYFGHVNGLVFRLSPTQIDPDRLYLHVSVHTEYFDRVSSQILVADVTKVLNGMKVNKHQQRYQVQGSRPERYEGHRKTHGQTGRGPKRR
jgi:hypothetical protein